MSEKLREAVLTLRDHYKAMAIQNPGAMVDVAEVTASLSRILRPEERRDHGEGVERA